MNGTELLLADGYRLVLPLETNPEHYDDQGHLNNAAIAQIFSELRLTYHDHAIAAEQREIMRAQGVVVAVREAQLLYESEGRPGEQYLAGVRYTHREGKAAIVEQRIVESETGRPIAHAWALTLMLLGGAVVNWPEPFLDAIAAFEGRAIDRRPRSDRLFIPF